MQCAMLPRVDVFPETTMRTLIAALVLVVAPLTHAAPACKIPGMPKIIGLDYHQARAKLIVAGFRPVLADVDEIRDRGAELATPTALGYFEVAACAGSGTAPCAADWRTPKKRPFSVYTVGHLSEVSGFDCGH